MRLKGTILFIALLILLVPTGVLGHAGDTTSFIFLKDTFYLNINKNNAVDFKGPLSEASIRAFYDQAMINHYGELMKDLKKYKQQQQLDDWSFYQLIRSAAQSISPKANNYHRYTLYKWIFLRASGYDPILTIHDDKILMYVRSSENVYNIPLRSGAKGTYVCLNYHDYNFNIDFEKEHFEQVMKDLPGGTEEFSYKINRIPEFDERRYQDKTVHFTYDGTRYEFKLKVNPEVQSFFRNYPVVDYERHLNTPISKKTYESLINSIRPVVKSMKQKDGVDFLMHFTRDAFSFKRDTEVFGAEKRMSPEQTLLYEYSDCEDRSALFFFLVKELYNLPMIVLAYPEHVTVAVKFDKPFGKIIQYNGTKYTMCEPSPQKTDLSIGQALPQLTGKTYQVVYDYPPAN